MFRRWKLIIAAVACLLAVGTAASAATGGHAAPRTPQRVQQPGAHLAAAGTSARPPAGLTAKARAAWAALPKHIGLPDQTATAGRAGPDTDAIPAQTSLNWSGYQDTKTKTGAFRNVAATWDVPSILPGVCDNARFANGEGLAAFWVGLDGAGTGTVEQDGTISECYHGSVYYWDWYEMYPQAINYVAQVNEGQQISGYVDYTGGYYALSLVDNQDTSASFFEIQSCGAAANQTCNRGSAEVIAESPSLCTVSQAGACRGTYYLMPDFGWVSFWGISDATYNNGGSLASGIFGPAKVKMIDGAGNKLAYVARTWHNDAFRVNWNGPG